MSTVEQKNRFRAFAGAFVGMVSPLLLAIVLKKTDLKGKWFPLIFSLLAVATLEVGMVPFLCVMISEAFPDYVSERLLIASKVMVFVSNILLMFLGFGVLFFIHKSACFSWLVVSACFMVLVFATIFHIYSCCCWYRRRGENNVEGPRDDDYQSKLEHSLEFSAGVTAMMFLVLGSVVLEGLLRSSSQLPHPTAPAPSDGGPVTKEPRKILAATLLVTFFTSAFAAFLMNVWTIPLEVLTGASAMGFLNIALAALAFVVVTLITWEGVQVAAWLALLPPFVLLLRLLASCGRNKEDGRTQPPPHPDAAPDVEVQQQPDGQTQQRPPNEETKPAPLELTKVMFTGLLAVAVPGITNASPGMDKNACVVCSAAAVLLGLLWRILTHDNAPTPAVREAVNLSSFFALASIFCAGIAFGVMAVNAPN